MLPPSPSHMPPRLPAPPRSPPSLPAFRPLVFDLTLEVDNSSLAGNGDSGWRVLHVYGSPNPNDTSLSGGGTIMKLSGRVVGRESCGVCKWQSKCRRVLACSCQSNTGPARLASAADQHPVPLPQDRRGHQGRRGAAAHAPARSRRQQHAPAAQRDLHRPRGQAVQVWQPGRGRGNAAQTG